MLVSALRDEIEMWCCKTYSSGFCPKLGRREKLGAELNWLIRFGGSCARKIHHTQVMALQQGLTLQRNQDVRVCLSMGTGR